MSAFGCLSFENFNQNDSNIPKTEAIGKALLSVGFLETFESL